jgi:acyl-CoA synthetase (AMP-forming)/AMP-acid ligase II
MHECVEQWQAAGIDAVTDHQPQATAVVDNSGTDTYAQLHGRIGNAMRLLRSRGASAGATVLLIAPNTREAVAVYLAALGLGARVVLLDRRAGAADVRHAVAATRPVLVVGDTVAEALADLYQARVLPLINVEAAEGTGYAIAADLAHSSVVMFTSGTSSRPKAVLHKVQSLLAGARNMAQTLAFTSRDGAFLVSPLAGITGIAQLHLALECGGRLVLEDAFSPTASLSRLIDHDATVFGGAPFILESLLAEAAKQHHGDLPLRAVAVGGTSIPRALLEDAWSRHRMVPSRVYGSSECPIAFASAPSDDLEARFADDGIPMPGTEGRIDPANGELQVRGESLFSRYLDPADNAEAFTSDGWFRTGDLAVLSADRLRITGRLKEVVARKGLKISLAEVDEKMRGLPGSLGAASYGLPDAETGERLAVAIHADGHSEMGLETVTQWLRAAGVATWKLPEQVVVWNEPLPHTATGKVLRRALADGGAGRPTHIARRLFKGVEPL